jgi:hypothetical protein
VNVPQVSINFLAVLIAAAANMALGAIWYSMRAFGKAWIKESGAKMDGNNAGPAYMLTTVASLFAAYVLAHFTQYTAAVTPLEGAVTGLWLGLGFVATSFGATALFSGWSLRLYLIQAGYQVAGLVLMGAIVASFA